MISNFFNSAKNIGMAIIVWGIIAFVALEIFGGVYVNFFQRDPGAPVEPPSISKAQYEVYIDANRRLLYSNKVDQAGSIITLNGYYYLDGDKYRYAKLPFVMDERYFGNIEVTKR